MAESLTSDERARRRYGKTSKPKLSDDEKENARQADVVSAQQTQDRNEIAGNYAKLRAAVASGGGRAKAASDTKEVSDVVRKGAKSDDDE